MAHRSQATIQRRPCYDLNVMYYIFIISNNLQLVQVKASNMQQEQRLRLTYV